MATWSSLPPANQRSPIRFMQPSLPPLQEVVDLYRDVYNTGMITNAQLVERLERALAERLNVKHCIAVSSCTSGLALLMKALGLRGEVILPSFTFFATGQAVLWNSLTPVFADCHPETWNIDPADIAHRITPVTSAIIGVHVYGNPADVRDLEKVAKDARVKLIFDAAHAMGSSYLGRPIGGFGDAEVFSLSPSNLLVAGEGGIVTTNDAALAHRMRAARNYGDVGAYNPVVCGMNARMSEFNAALAYSGISLLDEKVKRHNEIAGQYRRELTPIPGLRVQMIHHRNVSTYNDFSFYLMEKVCGWGAKALCAELAQRGIPTKRYYDPPLHKQNIFAGLHSRFDRPLFVTECISEGIVSLPIYQALTDEDVSHVTQTVRDILEKR